MDWLWLVPALVVTAVAAVIVARRRPSQRELDETRRWAAAMNSLNPKGRH